MKKILITADLVKRLLEEKPETRSDDYLLWAETILATMRESECPLNNLNMIYVLKHIRELKIPDFGTVGRARRKLQEKYPELRGSERVRKGRAKREVAFKGFAKL